MKATEFKQKAKVGVAGLFQNQLMSNNSSKPEVGKGATQLMYSDRHCFEVVEVSKDGKTVKMQDLQARHDKTKEGGQGHQNWIFEPTGNFTTVVWKNGSWKVKTNMVVITKEYTAQYESQPHTNARWNEMIKPLFNQETNCLMVIEGKTKLKTEYFKINILFGVKDYYYDWSF